MMPYLPVLLMLLFLHSAPGTEIEGYACLDMKSNSILVSQDNVYLLDKAWADCQVPLGSAVKVEADQEERLLKNAIIKNIYRTEKSTVKYTNELLLSGKLSYLGPKTPTIMLDIPIGGGRSVCLDFWEKGCEWLKAAAIAKKDLTTKAKIRVTVDASKPEMTENIAPTNQKELISLRGIYDSGIFQMRGYEMLHAGQAYIDLIDRAEHPADAPAFQLRVGDSFTAFTEVQLELDGFSVRELKANEYDPSMQPHRGLMITHPGNGTACIIYLTATGEVVSLCAASPESEPPQVYVQEITL